MLLAVSSPRVRQTKLQALTRWNDEQGRTSDEVLVIIDRLSGGSYQTWRHFRQGAFRPVLRLEATDQLRCRQPQQQHALADTRVRASIKFRAQGLTRPVGRQLTSCQVTAR